MTTLFSVIIPSFSRAQILPNAIKSVLKQNFQDFELIVVDDGSTDNTREVVSSFDDSRIRYLFQQNRGPSAARNTGANHATGKYLIFLDSDDEAAPEWLNSFYDRFQKDPAVKVVCAGIKIIEDDSAEEIQLPRKLGPVYDSQIGLFLSGTFAVHRDLFLKAGGYNESLHYAETSDLALRLIPMTLSEGAKIATIPRPLVTYHKQPRRWAKGTEHFQLRLETAEFFIRNHGDAYRTKHPRGLSNHFAIAGVNAARLGRYTSARDFFLSAIRAYPWHWRNYSRLLLTIFPVIGRKLWLRFN
jgi:glycosyltransferase involved in cell wall biosynthesis